MAKPKNTPALDAPHDAPPSEPPATDPAIETTTPPSVADALADARALIPPAGEPPVDPASEPARGKPGPKPLTPEERERRKRERDARYNAERRSRTNAAVASDVTTAVRGSRAALAAQLVEANERAARAEAAAAGVMGANSDAIRKGLSDMVQTIARVGTRLVAAKRGAHWNVTDKEAREIGDSAAAVLVVHWSKIEAYSPYVGVAFAVGSFVALRVQVDAGALTVEQLRERAGIAIESPNAGEIVAPVAVSDSSSEPAKVEGAPAPPTGMRDE